MTAVERQQRHRAARARYHELPFEKTRKANPTEIELLRLQQEWLKSGNIEDVAEWLSFQFLDLERWDKVSANTREKIRVTRDWINGGLFQGTIPAHIARLMPDDE